jgi:hypothetical protein
MILSAYRLIEEISHTLMSHIRAIFQYDVQNIAQTAAAIIMVASQPNIFSLAEITNCPMIFGRDAINIMTAMIGTEITPLITALQYNALIGSIDVNPSTIPIKVEAAIVP